MMNPLSALQFPTWRCVGWMSQSLCRCLLFLPKSRCQCLSNRCHLSRTLIAGLICLTLLCPSSGQKLVFSSATMCQKLQSLGKLLILLVKALTLFVHTLVGKSMVLWELDPLWMVRILQWFLVGFKWTQVSTVNYRSSSILISVTSMCFQMTKLFQWRISSSLTWLRLKLFWKKVTTKSVYRYVTAQFLCQTIVLWLFRDSRV